ncbi:MAG: hypothetical protein AB1449_04600 [Chloroflexota bacterium]
MNEPMLRWQARLSSLRPVGIVLWIVVAFFLVISGPDVVRAFRSPAEAESLTIGQLMADGHRAHPFVSLTGYAYYEIAYQETSDGSVVASYFPLIDERTGEVVLIRASDPRLTGRLSGTADFTGETHSTPSDLEALVREDIPLVAESGLTIDPTFYLEEGSTPMDPLSAFTVGTLLIIAGAVGIVPFLFPATVFLPRPVPSLTPAVPSQGPTGRVRASGRFQQIRRLEPALELGRGHLRFTSAVANPIWLPDGRLMVYIRHIVTTKLYGVVTISRRESHWGIFIGRMDLWQIDPGQVLGWRDRWAVRFRRQEMGRKPETVFLTFDTAPDQAAFVQRLRQAGFAVSMGIAT